MHSELQFRNIFGKIFFRFDFVVNANVVSLSIPATSINAGITDSRIIQYRGDNWSINITGLPNLTGYSKIWFTVKRSYRDLDSESWIQIDSTTGLLYINSTVATTAANGSIVVNDASTGDITITLSDVESAKLPVKAGEYDVQWMNSTNVVKTISIGDFIVTGDISRVTS